MPESRNNGVREAPRRRPLLGNDLIHTIPPQRNKRGGVFFSGPVTKNGQQAFTRNRNWAEAIEHESSGRYPDCCKPLPNNEYVKTQQTEKENWNTVEPWLSNDSHLEQKGSRT
jgi:hypothetical protein